MDGYFFLLLGCQLQKDYFNFSSKNLERNVCLYTAYIMRMQIIEQFIASKYGDDVLCEDGLFINDKFIAVMDGVTAKGDILLGQVSQTEKPPLMTGLI